MIESSLSVWLNVAAMLALTGFIIWISCISSTTYFDD